MTSEELQVLVLAIGTAKISAFAGALGAVAVLALLSIVRDFADWMLAREERAQRIAAARSRFA